MSENNATTAPVAASTEDRRLVQKVINQLSKKVREQKDPKTRSLPLILATLAGLGSAGYVGYNAVRPAEATAQIAAPADDWAKGPQVEGVKSQGSPASFKKLSHVEAHRHVGEYADISFAAAGGKRFNENIAVVNASSNYKAPDAFTVVLRGPAFAAMDPRTWKGRPVRVRGQITRYGDRPQPQIVVEDPAHIQVGYPSPGAFAGK